MSTRKHISKWIKKQVHRRQFGNCNHCGDDLDGIGQLDHITPLMVGGAETELCNLQYLCPNCHAYKTMQETQLYKRCRMKTSHGEMYCDWCDTTYSSYFPKHICSMWPVPEKRSKK